MKLCEYAWDTHIDKMDTYCAVKRTMKIDLERKQEELQKWLAGLGMGK